MQGLTIGGIGVASGLALPRFFCDHSAGVNGNGSFTLPSDGS